MFERVTRLGQEIGRKRFSGVHWVPDDAELGELLVNRRPARRVHLADARTGRIGARDEVSIAQSLRRKGHQFGLLGWVAFLDEGIRRVGVAQVFAPTLQRCAHELPGRLRLLGEKALVAEDGAVGS